MAPPVIWIKHSKMQPLLLDFLTCLQAKLTEEFFYIRSKAKKKVKVFRGSAKINSK